MKNIAFVSLGQENSKYGRMLVDSIKKTNSSFRIIQISKIDDDKIKNIDEKLTSNFNAKSLMLNRLESQIKVVKKYGATIFLDADMIVTKDLSKVFDLLKEYDLILTKRKNDFLLKDKILNIKFPDLTNKTANDFVRHVNPWLIKESFLNIRFPEFTNKNANESMPFNGGFIASSSVVFLEKILEIYLKLPKRFRYWYGDQVALKKIFDKQKSKIKILETTYNYNVENLSDYNEEVYIYHFKGEFKKLMKPFFRRYFKYIKKFNKKNIIKIG